MDLEIYQMDVKTAFLSDDLEEDIYMVYPERFVQQREENIVYKLKKFIVRVEAIAEDMVPKN